MGGGSEKASNTCVLVLIIVEVVSLVYYACLGFKVQIAETGV